MATKVAQRRLQKEYLAMQKQPPPFIWACPEEKNILDWHFIIRGPPDSPYAGGEYHGLIWFPSDYPFKPPDVKMFTPSGRFETGKKICMSMTSYHPSTWNAAWSVATILTGLLSFMLGEDNTAGATVTTVQQKKQLAQTSHAFNLANKKFKEVFPDYATPEMKDLPDMGQQPPSSSTPSEPSLPVLPLKIPPDSDITEKHGDRGNEAEKESDTKAMETIATTVVPIQNRRVGWTIHWKWVIAVVFIAVLGRLSAFV